jgi:Pyridoxamine 5'-phosphate oxidase
MTADRQHQQLTKDECLRLLASVPFGRIVFTSGALPAVRPASHLMLNGELIIRAGLGAAITPTADGAGVVVAYEADQVDPDRLSGWSVTVIGRARQVADEALADRYRGSLWRWSSGEPDRVITIAAEVVAGFRMNPVPETAA